MPSLASTVPDSGARNPEIGDGLALFVPTSENPSNTVRLRSGSVGSR